MLTLFLLSGCLIDRDLYERRRAELLAAAEEDTDTPDDTACTPAPVWVDADGDGWGNTAYPDERCGDLTGWAATDGDCDDGDPAVHPDAAELCATSADDDCDGAVNEAGATDGVGAFADADGDGFGDSAVAGVVCELGAGWVADATDCDDGDVTVNPGAEEVCNTGVDEDCDAETTCRLEGEIGVGEAEVTWAVEGEAMGIPAPVGDLSGDGLDDVLFLASGGAYLLSDPGDGTWDMADSGPVVTEGASLAEMYLFKAVSLDFDGDGVRDVVASAIGPEVFGPSTVYLFDGPFDRSRTSDDAASAMEGDGVQILGFGISAAADLSGDGVGGLVVTELSLTGTSSVYIVPAGGGFSIQAASTRLTGGPSDIFGYAVASGDANDDGLEDLVVAAPMGEGGVGVVYVFHGPLVGDVVAYDNDGRIVGLAEGDALGVSPVFAPFLDADGDGDADLLIGAYQVSSVAEMAGAAYLFTGPIGNELDAGDAVGTYAGAHADAGMGYAASGAGDVDGDGRGDLLLGASPSSAADTTARVYLMYGPASGTYVESELDATFRPEAGADDTRLGQSPIAPGDTDGDGLADLFLGDPLGMGGVGAAYLYRGTGR